MRYKFVLYRSRLASVEVVLSDKTISILYFDYFISHRTSKQMFDNYQNIE